MSNQAMENVVGIPTSKNSNLAVIFSSYSYYRQVALSIRCYIYDKISRFLFLRYLTSQSVNWVAITQY